MKIYKLNMKYFKLTYIILAIFIMFSSCDKRSTERGYSFLPDMEKSQAYDTYSENPNFIDSMTLRKPVEGTVPRKMIPYHLTKTDEDLSLAGKKFKNPLKNTNENITQGKLQYERFCMQCHGEKGDGQGFLFTSGKYSFPPGNLGQEKTINRSDGEIYHIINVGINIMGAHASQISQEDRWKIVLYIRNDLQNLNPEK
ncbi:MAG: cytochrome c [Bacteroidales bacterium]